MKKIEVIGVPTCSVLDRMTYTKNYYGIESYSQFGQDNYIIDSTGAKRNGFFLDIGANDAIKISNTYTLEKNLGWKGVLVECDSRHYEKILKLRTNSRLCPFGITTIKNKKDRSEFLTFDEIAERYQIPEHIDYMSLDIDGSLDSEFDVLSDIDFSKHRFDIIDVEHDAYNGEVNCIKREKYHEVLSRAGYVYYGDLGPDDFFIHRDFKPVNLNNDYHFGLEIKRK